MAQALQIEALLSGVVDTSGNVLEAGLVDFFETDGVTRKTIWEDSEKVSAAANPYTLSSVGTASVFASGTYNIVVKDSGGTVIYNWNAVQFNPSDSTTFDYILAKDYGTAQNKATLDLAISAAAGNDRTIYIGTGNWAIDDNLTIPTNINLRVEMGAYFTVANTKTLTISGVVEAPLYNIFRGTGTVTFSDGRVNDRPSIWGIGGTHNNRTILGTWSLTGQLNVDSLRLDGNTLSSTSGDINITPLAGEDVVIDGHFEFDGTTLTALTDSNTTITAYAGKNITIESVTFDGGVVGGVSQLNVDNLRLDGNTLSSTTGDINITPLPGEDVVIDGHFEFDGTVLTALTDSNTTITAYAGKNITIESVTFDGGVVGGISSITATTISDGTASLNGGSLTGVTNLAVDNLNLNGNTLSSTTGDINITPLAGQDVVIDGHFEFDGTVLTALTDSNTTITAYAGKNITIESVTFDGGVVGGISSITATTISDGTASLNGGSLTGVTNLAVDNLNLNGNTLSSTSGDINITPLAGQDVVIDGHFEFDGTVLTALTDSNTTITAYAGKNITIESVTFDGGEMVASEYVTGKRFKYSETQLWSLANSSYLVNTLGSNWYYDVSNGYYTATTGGCYLPINLPNGVTITSLVASLYGDSATTSVRLYRVAWNNFSSLTEMAVTSHATTTKTTVTDSTITSAVIDNDNYCYVLNFGCSGGPESRVYGVKISYNS